MVDHEDVQNDVVLVDIDVSLSVDRVRKASQLGDLWANKFISMDIGGRVRRASVLLFLASILVFFSGVHILCIKSTIC